MAHHVASATQLKKNVTSGTPVLDDDQQDHNKRQVKRRDVGMESLLGGPDLQEEDLAPTQRMCPDAPLPPVYFAQESKSMSR